MVSRRTVGSVGVRSPRWCRSIKQKCILCSLARTAIQNSHFAGIDLPRSRFIKVAPGDDVRLPFQMSCGNRTPSERARIRAGGWFPSCDLGKVNKWIGSGGNSTHWIRMMTGASARATRVCLVVPYVLWWNSASLVALWRGVGRGLGGHLIFTTPPRPTPRRNGRG